MTVCLVCSEEHDSGNCLPVLEIWRQAGIDWLKRWPRKQTGIRVNQKGQAATESENELQILEIDKLGQGWKRYRTREGGELYLPFVSYHLSWASDFSVESSCLSSLKWLSSTIDSIELFKDWSNIPSHTTVDAVTKAIFCHVFLLDTACRPSIEMLHTRRFPDWTSHGTKYGCEGYAMQMKKCSASICSPRVDWRNHCREF